MKIILATIIIIVSILSISNSTEIKSKKIQNEETILSDDLNQSIIDGFFDGDTIGKDISGIHFVK